MGMYNEVFYLCPECNGVGYMQIYQIVEGFGGFSLPDGEGLKELSIVQLYELKEVVMKHDFVCQDCGHVFNPYKNDKKKEELIQELFAVEENSEV